MAVTVDNTGANAGGTTLLSLTISSFAVGAGSNRLIYCGVSQYATVDVAPTAKFNTSETFTFHDATTISESPGTRRSSILYLKAPSNVTQDIIVSWATTATEAVIGATSWSVVDQTTSVGTAVKNSGTSGTSSTVSIPNASGDVVHDTISVDAVSAVEVTANQTQRWRAIAAANTSEGAGQSAAGAGSNISCTWSTFFSGATFAHIGVAIKQASSTPAILGKITRSQYTDTSDTDVYKSTIVKPAGGTIATVVPPRLFQSKYSDTSEFDLYQSRVSGPSLAKGTTPVVTASVLGKTIKNVPNFEEYDVYPLVTPYLQKQAPGIIAQYPGNRFVFNPYREEEQFDFSTVFKQTGQKAGIVPGFPRFTYSSRGLEAIMSVKEYDEFLKMYGGFLNKPSQGGIGPVLNVTYVGGYVGVNVGVGRAG